jgi:transglutaminase/protease-like cytokinesis protein 3
MQSYKQKVRSQEELWRLSYFIRHTFAEDSLRLRAAFVWITHNIDYDIKAVENEDPRAAQLDYVVKKGKAVCSGYANLLKFFCDSYNLENVVVEGRARGLKSDVYISNTRFFGNHAWNAVKVNDIWRLIDATWAAGSVTGDDNGEEIVKKRYVREFEEFYYFPPPERFALNHYPRDLRYSYVTKIPAYKDFARTPLFTTHYSKGALTAVYPQTSLLEATVGDTLTFRFQSTNLIQRVDFLSKKEKASFGNFAKEKEGWYEVKYPVAVSGYYDLNLVFNDEQVISVIYKIRAQPKY